MLLSQRLEEASLAASEEAKEELLITMKELMLSGEGAVHMLRQFFPEEVVLADNNQYYFFPIMDTLARHSYEQAGFQNILRLFLCLFHTGSLRKEINTRRDTVIQCAFYIVCKSLVFYDLALRIAAYAEPDKGVFYAVPCDFIPAGVYFFTQATSVEEAKEEAQYVLDALEPYDVTYPVVLDVEAVTSKFRSFCHTGSLCRFKKADIYIHFSVNPRHTAGIRILPYFKIIWIVKFLVIMCKPFIIFFQFFKIKH